MLLALFVAPGHALALFAPNGDLGAFADPKHSAAQWKVVRGRILAATKQAKALREKREKLAAAERAAAAALVAPTASRPAVATQPVPRKAELPILSYQCDSARFQISYQSFPLAGFDNIGAYRDQCKPEAPAGKDSIAQKDALGMCPGGSYTCPDLCCPPGYPILNLCDKQCYKTSDFMGGSDVGLVCTRYVNCAYWAPTK